VRLELARSWSAASHRLDSIWAMLWNALMVILSILVHYVSVWRGAVSPNISAGQFQA
jgi:hypothetical protein